MAMTLCSSDASWQVDSFLAVWSYVNRAQATQNEAGTPRTACIQIILAPALNACIPTLHLQFCGTWLGICWNKLRLPQSHTGTSSAPTAPLTLTVIAGA
jgi:hypothetical protein